MGRLWLALAVVAALTGTALAKRDPGCTNAAPRVLPAPGSVDVPTNVRLWNLPSTSAPDRPFTRYEFAPNSHNEIGGTSFTTAAGRDDTPPEPPAFGAVAITVTKVVASDVFDDALWAETPDVGATVPRPVTLLRVAAIFDADTAVVRLRFAQAGRVTTFFTSPDQLSICMPGFELMPGSLDVEVVAIDLAGNVSEAATRVATAVIDDHGLAPGGHRNPRHDHGYIAILLLPPFAVCMVLLLVVVARSRSRARLATPPLPIALPAAEALARALRMRGVLALAALAAASTYATTNDDVLALTLLASPVLVLVVFVAISRVVDSARAVSLLRYDGVTAETQGDQVEIAVGAQTVVLRAPRRLVERARARGLPSARRA